MKMGLRAKFIIFFLFFGMVMLGGIWLVVYLFTGKLFWRLYADLAGKAADLAAYSLDLTPEEIRRYGSLLTEDDHYWEVLEQMEEMRRISGLEYLYIIYPTSRDTAIWLFDTEKNGEELGNPVVDFLAEESHMVRDTYLTGERSQNLDFTSYNKHRLISIYNPLKDEDGNTIAVLGADVALEKILMLFFGSLVRISIWIVSLTAVGMFCMLLLVQFGVIGSIRKLKTGVQKLSEGELGVQVFSRRKDELGEITEVFNRMSQKIKGHIREMEGLNHAYQKFIPPETFDILHKNSVVEIELGDYAKTNLTILSMQACAFREKTNGMSAEEIFLYINGILETIVPAILGEGGTIMRFEKAGACSYYRNHTEYALRSAVSACTKLGEKGERMSVGIARGMVMMGIAGEEDRMDIVSISEQSRMSVFLMEAAPKYHASVLICESAAKEIADFRNSYHSRFLGYIKNTSSGRLDLVFDVFDADLPEERRLKQMTKESFERGIDDFCQGNYREARQSFIEVIKQNRKDAASKIYLDLCSRYLQEKETAGNIWIEEI